MKKIAILILVIAVSLLSGCQNFIDYHRNPIRFEGSEWRSDDESIEFCVGEDGIVRGSIMSAGRSTEVFIKFPADGPYMIVYPIDLLSKEYLEPEDQYEFFTCFFESKTHFVAEINYYSTFFHIGDKIEFQRIK